MNKTAATVLGRKTLTIEEFHSQLRAQGVPEEHLAFVCPMCGTIQSGFDLIAAGAGPTMDSVEKYLGFSCVGRWTHHKPPPEHKGTQSGCNWTLGGLFQFHVVEIRTPDGKLHPQFELATPEQAQVHMAKNIAENEKAVAV